MGLGTTSQFRYFSWRSSMWLDSIQILGLFLDHGEWLVDHFLLGNSGGDYRGGMANTRTCVRKISKCQYGYC